MGIGMVVRTEGDDRTEAGVCPQAETDEQRRGDYTKNL
jgi:hypothetical protein